MKTAVPLNRGRPLAFRGPGSSAAPFTIDKVRIGDYSEEVIPFV